MKCCVARSIADAAQVLEGIHSSTRTHPTLGVPIPGTAPYCPNTVGPPYLASFHM
jgi:hypothetical protein